MAILSSYGVLNPGIKQLHNKIIDQKMNVLKVRPFGLLSGVGQAALNFDLLSLACLAN